MKLWKRINASYEYYYTSAGLRGLGSVQYAHTTHSFGIWESHCIFLFLFCSDSLGFSPCIDRQSHEKWDAAHAAVSTASHAILLSGWVVRVDRHDTMQSSTVHTHSYATAFLGRYDWMSYNEWKLTIKILLLEVNV